MPREKRISIILTDDAYQRVKRLQELYQQAYEAKPALHKMVITAVNTMIARLETELED